MKKLSLLIVLVMVAGLLMGVASPTKLVRLTMINKSDYDVFMKLEGSPVTKAYYYLSLPKGSRDEPVVKVFTIWVDVYQRTTWQCGGIKSTGLLVVSQNIRLDFTPCGEFACLKLMPVASFTFECFSAGRDLVTFTDLDTKKYAGEPTMEKVTYFKYLETDEADWTIAHLADGWWNFGCFLEYYRIRNYKLPAGCAFRYQY